MPVGLLGFAKKTNLVFLVTLESISLTDIVKFFSLAKITFAPLVLL